MLIATQRIRIEWAHCDPAGILFNPNYYLWMDSGTHALLHAAGFDLAAEVRADPLFRGCPLVSSGMDFMRPYYFGDIATCVSQVEKFGNTSFVVRHEFRRGDEPEPFASGNEVRVWGYSDAQRPERLVAVRVPDDVRAILSVDGSVDVTP
ncbi:MAG: acyl-CoA thioesterase [Gammaproteobacteria bacterium]|nr:acyl-CoA thioesterase [Gammaproteobacteria bacterium]